MKKSQLYKMLLYSSTLYVLVYDVLNMFNIGGFLGLILFFISIVPIYILDREISRRIIFYQISKGIIKDEDLMEKFRKISDKTDDNDDEDDDED